MTFNHGVQYILQMTGYPKRPPHSQQTDTLATQKNILFQTMVETGRSSRAYLLAIHIKVATAD